MALEGWIFPPRLKENQRALAARYLATVPAEHRQSCWTNSPAGCRRTTRGQAGVRRAALPAPPVQQVNQKGFVENLGLKVQTERERRRAEAEGLREAAIRNKSAQHLRRDRAARMRWPKSASS